MCLLTASHVGVRLRPSAEPTPAKDAPTTASSAKPEDDVVAGNGPNIVTDGYNEIAIGTFVFLRNARFNAVSESTSNPRYWVARVTAGAVAPPSVCALARAYTLWRRCLAEQSRMSARASLVA